ncbi:transcriptional regulator, AraC family [Polaribacter sp. KT25b]|uniref:helix-turn-helix domain-containing protein n=1 Tax=Polaribacter sp. KT25b TaxID=1855336 RepID=UPI00087A2A10|nr:helix-turn-helix transcriptional regulator [Polaribacter sp. KT25b]SDR90407.1 transcriptional regulator, AraC family [Polaribacter sp. KT25b]
MSNKTHIINSIKNLHNLFGFKKPIHPLLSIISENDLHAFKNRLGEKFILNFYSISLKDQNCEAHFGRKNYNFDKGEIIFSAPNQTLTLSKTTNLNNNQGWILFFHPDLVRNTSLDKKIENYKFFTYDIDKALLLSDTEKLIITNCIELIKNEIAGSTDNYSKPVVVSTLDLLLNFCARFYERQYKTKSIHTNNIVTQVSSILKDNYDSGLFIKQGIPTVENIAEIIGITPNYLGDVLKKETGKNAKDFINSYIIDKAKTLLLNDNITISKLAFDLGFNYPHYFSRLFKAKTGLTPNQYRQNH